MKSQKNALEQEQAECYNAVINRRILNQEAALWNLEKIIM